MTVHLVGEDSGGGLGFLFFFFHSLRSLGVR